MVLSILARKSLVVTTVQSTTLSKEIERVQGTIRIAGICEHCFLAKLADFFTNSFICEPLSEVVLTILRVAGPFHLMG